MRCNFVMLARIAANGGAAAVRKHRRERLPFAARLAMAMSICMVAIIITGTNAFADTGLGEYLNNSAGATSVAYEYLTGDSWDDISHEGNSAPATALSMASQQGDYKNFAYFVDSCYHDIINPVSWYSNLEGIAFLNACTAAREDIAKCLKEHPLDGSPAPNETLGADNGGLDLTITMWGGKAVTDASGTTWYSTGVAPNLTYKPEFVIKLSSVAKSFVRANYNKHLICSLAKDTNGNKSYYSLIIYALDDSMFDIATSNQTYQRGYEEVSLVQSFLIQPIGASVNQATRYQVYSREVPSNLAPWEAYFDRNESGNIPTAISGLSINGNGSNSIGYNKDQGIVDNYVPPVTEPDNPTPPDPDEPINVPIFVGNTQSTFDTTDIVAAIETLDADMLAAFNNLSDYLHELFEFLDSNLQSYFYQLDNDLVNSIKWLRQEFVNSIDGLDGDINDGFSDLGEKLDAIENDLNHYLYRFELQLNNIYSRLGSILNKLGGNGNDVVETRPDPADDNDGFLDWLWQLFETGLEDLLEQLNLTGLVSKFSRLASKFPFSIPWDLASFIALFIHDPVTPVFTLPLPHFAIDGTYYTEMEIDFTQWQIIGQASRDGTFILFAVGLALRTKDLLDNERLD